MAYNVKIEEISTDDMFGIFELGKTQEQHNPLLKWSTNNISEIFASNSSLCLVAKYRNKILGYIITERDPINNSASIHWILVADEKKFPWLKKAIFKELIKKSKDLKIQKIFSFVSENSENSETFHKMDFTQIERFTKVKLELNAGEEDDKS